MQLWDLVLDSNSAVPTGSSCIQLIHDSTSSSSLITPPSILGSHSQEEGIMTTESRVMDRGYELDQTVLHIQSPNLSKTFIQCPPRLLVPEREAGEGILTTTMPSFSSSSFGLGLKYPCIHLHVRNLGKEWSFEVGIMDTEGRLGVLRLSTFQVLFSFLLIVLLFPLTSSQKKQETSKTQIPTSSSPIILSSISSINNMDHHQFASTHFYSLLFSTAQLILECG